MIQLCKVMMHKEKLICWTQIRIGSSVYLFKIPIAIVMSRVMLIALSIE